MPQFKLPWMPLNKASETADSNSKTFTVPSNEYWEITNIHVNYTAADTNDRQIEVQYLNDSGNIIYSHPAKLVIATTSARIIDFGIGSPEDLFFSDTDKLLQSLSLIPLLSAYTVKIFDNNNESSSDDMLIRLSGRRYFV